MATATIASAIGEPPTITMRAAGRWGSRKISSAPPLRHGLRSTTAPSMASTPSASPSSGTSRSSSGSPVSIARSACRRTEDSAHTPPTKPSMRPVGQHDRRVARAHAGGAPGADDGREHERGPLGQQALDVDGEVALNHLTQSFPCIASHTRPGVQGMSMCITPNGSRASHTALTIAGGEPTVADSPIPLAPKGWWGDGVTV